jgi:hypothetical protein
VQLLVPRKARPKAHPLTGSLVSRYASQSKVTAIAIFWILNSSLVSRYAGQSKVTAIAIFWILNIA